MALWMTVEQEIFGLAAVLLVFSCALVRGFVRGRGRGKGRRPAFFAWKKAGSGAGRGGWKVWTTWWRRPVLGGITVAGIIVAGVGCVIGVCRMEWEQAVVWREEALIAACAEAAVAVEGIVAEIDETDYGWRLVLEKCAVEACLGEAEKEAIVGSVVNTVDAPDDHVVGKSVDTNVTGDSVRKMYAYVESSDGLKLGMKVRVSGELELTEPDRNPGQFDFRNYCLAKGICGSLSGDSVEIVDGRYLWVQEGLRQIGLVLERRLELIADEEDVGLLKAILLGEKGDMDDEVYKLYQKNGISHVLAISGLHVSVIGMGLWNGLRRLGAGYWSAGVAAFGMLFCFGSVAGFGPSVVRAVFMMGISFLAGAFGRTYDLPSAMSVPAMGLLLYSPYMLTQALFQLSFLAVAAIFFPGAYLAKVWKLTGFWQNLWTSVSLQLVTFPVVLYHSFEIPVYGVILNLVVVPLMTYVLISGILGLAGSFLWMPLGPFLLGGAHYILWLYKQACRLIEQVTGAYLVLGRPEFGAIAVYYGCLVFGAWLAVVGGKRNTFGSRPGRLFWRGSCVSVLRTVTAVMREKIGEARSSIVAGMCRFAVLWFVGVLVLIPVPPSGLEVTFLDVGQGDGIFTRVRDKSLLVDCGSSQERSLGEDCLVPFLKSQGIDYLDAIAVTHGDQDHISGVKYLLEESQCGIEIGRLIMPVTGIGDDACEELEELAEKRGTPVYYLGQEMVENTFWQEILGDDVRVNCLHPEKPAGWTYVNEKGMGRSDMERLDAERSNEDGNSIDRNDSSLVLRLSYGNFSILLTGDVEATGESRMLEAKTKEGGELGPVTVLKAAHHGSASSTTQEFLDAADPAYVIFSYGAGNRYGHPRSEVVERCLESGAEIWKTAENGAIQIWTDGKKMQICGWLDRQKGI